jgi:autotransporter-associated beta strand protein
VNSGAVLTVSGFLNGVSGASWGGFTKLGGGTMTLTVANGYGGGSTLDAGTVIFSHGAMPLHNSGEGYGWYAADFEGNATLQWAAGNTDDLSATSGTAGNIKIGDGFTATFNPGGNNVTLGTAFVLGTNKTAALAVTGSGVLTLNASNGYSGGTTISGGMLQLGNASAMGVSSGALGISAGTLNMAGYSPTVGAVSGMSQLLLKLTLAS